MQVTTTAEAPSIYDQHPTHWNELIPGTRVEVSLENSITDRGVVDCVSEDGTVLWIWLEQAGQRTLFHYLDNVAFRLA